MAFRVFTVAIAVFATVVGFGSAVQAGDVALIVTNIQDVPSRSRRALEASHDELVDRLLARGYVVYSAKDPNREDLTDLIHQTEAILDEEGRLLIQYAGLAISVGERTGLVPSGTDITSRARVDTETVPLVALLDIAATRPAANLISLGIEMPLPEATIDFANDPARFQIPQGVAVLRGTPQGVIGVVSDQLIEAGRMLGEVEVDAEDARFEGLILDGMGFGAPEVPQTDVSPELDREKLAEEALWLFAESGDNTAALQIYLRRYPDGKYADEARRRLGLPDPDAPLSPARLEQELGLSRTARRAIQENLNTLGFSTRGVDGIFGPGTRSAVRSWQQSVNLEVTGFLDTEQIERLSRDAEIRATALRAEEERVARERRLADEAYWRQTGTSGEEADLRDYLRQYPQGLHAAEARRALDRIRENAEQQARTARRDAWNDARSANTLRAYRQFLRTYPDGEFSDQARKAIEDLQQNSATTAEIERYRDQERALGLTVGSALILEQRLRVAGHDPGAIDGKIDRDTRRAIAQFQTQQKLRVTGYFNPVTIQRLILTSSG